MVELLDERLPTRFWEKVRLDPVSGCWEWSGYKTPLGYGRFGFDGKSRYAHRVSYEVLVEAIPKGKELHHMCENPQCCNPHHLEPVTRREHQERTPRSQATINSSKEQCPQGHPYSDDNTRIESRSGGGTARRCLTCERERGQRSRTTAPGESNMDRHRSNICKRGHDLNDSWVDRNGTRKCRKCSALRARERRARLSEARPERQPSETCKNGHVYAEVGVYLYQDKRYCMGCRREADRRRR